MLQSFLCTKLSAKINISANRKAIQQIMAISFYATNILFGIRGIGKKSPDPSCRGLLVYQEPVGRSNCRLTESQADAYDIFQPMTRSPFHKFLSFVLIALILCATTTGLCHEVHAAEAALCKHCSHHDGPSAVAAEDGQSTSSPGAGHAESDHCTSSCYCSYHLPVIATGIEFAYSPVITDHLTQQTFNPPQDIFLSLFVPPDSPA